MQLDKAPAGGRDFWLWLTGSGQMEPGQGTVMNCWVSVLFCAYRAGLLTWGNLRAGYERAIISSRRILEPTLHSIHRASPQQINEHAGTLVLAWTEYVNVLDSTFFHSFRRVSFGLAGGPIPRRGDLVFVDGGPQGHVAISLGRTWKEGSPRDNVMSLWHHNGGTFAELNVESLGNSLSFVPCPFE